MPRVNIPEGVSAGAIDLRDYDEGQVAVERDDEGRYIEVDSEQAATAVADAYGTRIRSAGPETCQVVKTDGEICGRELPCQYHSEGS